MSKRRITAEMLTQKDACPDQLDEFRERFPDGLDPAAVTPEEVAGLSVGWAVHALLPATAGEAWKEAGAAAWKAWKEATSLAREAYREATAPAWKALNEKAGAPTRDAWKEAEAAAWKTYREDRAPAWEAYREAKARAAIDLFREYWQKEDHDE